MTDRVTACRGRYLLLLLVLAGMYVGFAPFRSQQKTTAEDAAVGGRIVEAPMTTSKQQQKSTEVTIESSTEVNSASGVEGAQGLSSGSGTLVQTEEPFEGSFCKRKWRSPQKSDLPQMHVISGYGDKCASELNDHSGRYVPLSTTAAYVVNQRQKRLNAPYEQRAELAFSNSRKQARRLPRPSSIFKQTLRELNCFPHPLDSAEGRKEWGELRALTKRVQTELDRRGLHVEVWYMAGRKGYLRITHHYLRWMLKRFGGVAERILWMHAEDQPYIPEFLKQFYGPSDSQSSFDEGDLQLCQLERYFWKNPGQLGEDHLSSKSGGSTKQRTRRPFWSEHIPEFIPQIRGNIRRMYRRAMTSNHASIFIKIDDDTVYIHPGTVTYLVAELLGIPFTQPRDDTRSQQHQKQKQPPERCQCVVASANVINHVGLNSVHFANNALLLFQEEKDSSVSRMMERKIGPLVNVSYVGFRKNVVGTFQHPIEWKSAHLSFLLSLASLTHHEKYGFHSHRFNFQCDGFFRRWGINFVGFPALGSGHFGGMRDVGHQFKNKDEIYLSMMYASNRCSNSGGAHSSSQTKTVPVEAMPRNQSFCTCAIGKALTVHFLNTGQASALRTLFGIDESHINLFKDASLVQPRLLAWYHRLALLVNYGAPPDMVKDVAPSLSERMEKCIAELKKQGEKTQSGAVPSFALGECCRRDNCLLLSMDPQQLLQLN